ncbi:MAG TPA: ATP-binding cassette domain-containing protein [Candidatus Dormibacteraeota bacterium]
MSGVRKTFGKRVVLDQLSFAASLGDVVAVVGDSGAGKTTLLRLIHGQLRPDRGQVWVDGHPLHRRFLRGVEHMRRDAGFIFQDHRLLPRLNALENVVVALQMARPDVPYGVIRRAANEALEQVGLGEDRAKFPAELSLGERQRVAVARTLALRPRLLLADEPTASLDETNAGRVLELLRHAACEGALVVVATHHLDFGAAQVLSLPRLPVPAKQPRRLPRPRTRRK